MSIQDQIKIPDVELKFVKIPDGSIPQHEYDGMFYHPPEFEIRADAPAIKKRDAIAECYKQLESSIRYALNKSGKGGSATVVVGHRSDDFATTDHVKYEKGDAVRYTMVHATFSVSVHAKTVIHESFMLASPYSLEALKK